MSGAQLDVYRDWLEIQETARPLTHYQLLGLKLFEDDANVIRSSYRKLNAHVRKYASGEYGPQSQELLNELCQAMLCLTDAVRKTEYDASLGRAAAPVGKAKTFEELLVARKVVTAEQLDKARRLSKTIGVDVRDAIMQQRSASAEQVMPVFAESLGLPYIELGDVQIDENLLAKVPAVTARQQSCAPLMVADGRVLVMAPHMLPPEIEDLLRLRFGMPMRLVLSTPGDVNQLIGKYYSREAAAAEMSAGPSKISDAPPAPAATDGQPAKPKAPVSRYSLSPEERAAADKKKRMALLMAFNFGFMATMFVAMAFGYTMKSFLKPAAVGVVVGLVSVGATYVVLGSKRL